MAHLGHLGPVSQRISLFALVLGPLSGLKSVQAIVSSDADAVDRSEGNRLFTVDALRHMSNQRVDLTQLQDNAGGLTHKQHDSPAASQVTATSKRGKVVHQQSLDQYNQKLWREAELEAEQESRNEEQLRQLRMSQKAQVQRSQKQQQKLQPQPPQSFYGMLRLWWNTTSQVVHVCQALGLCLVTLCLAAAIFGVHVLPRSSCRWASANKAPPHSVPAMPIKSESGQCEEEHGGNKSLYLYELTSRKYPDLQELKGDLEARLQAIAKGGRGTAVFAVGSAPPGEMASSCAQQ